MAVDQQGRVWVGHLNHGVSVFNGVRWQNYDVPHGPIGERIFKIAVCPTDGDVWLATSGGLTRYEVSRDTWKHYTRGQSGKRKAEGGNENHLTPALSPASGGEGESKPESPNSYLLTATSQLPAGLPSDQINAIAFDRSGNIYIGTQCDGVARAAREGNYQDWKRLPTNGLPSRLINDLLVLADGTVYAATTAGLAWSWAGAVNWQYRRGKDYPEKLKRLAVGAITNQLPASFIKNLLPQDYVTCLTEDVGGVVWLGFRAWPWGVQAWHHPTKQLLDKVPATQVRNADYVRAILPLPDGRLMVGDYGAGLLQTDTPVWPGRTNLPVQSNLSAGGSLPSPARSPTLAELNELLKEIESVPTSRMPNGAVLSLEDDWRTEGEWTGRYGRFWIALCANWSPKDDVWGAGWNVMYDARIGANHGPGDSLRYWIHWLATTQNRCLEMSPTYLHSRVLKGLTTWGVDRRQSEWDDHGEVYPMSQDGPHIYCSLDIPAGLFYLSLYDVNKDGRAGANRFRDFQISVRQHPGRASLDQHFGNTTVIRSFYDLEQFNQKPELARGRIVDFYEGVYKRFLVRGPTKLTIEVNRNHSYNTILPGVMLDLVDELPPPYFCTRAAWEAKTAEREKAARGAVGFIPADTAKEAAQRLAADLDAMPCKNEAWWAENKRRFYLPLARWQLAQYDCAKSAALTTSFYELNQFSFWESGLKRLGITPAREIEKALRWDGVTFSYAGQGNRIVNEYLKAHSAQLPKPSEN